MTLQTQNASVSNTTLALRDTFLKWQCLKRQISVRQNQGRPDAASTPAVSLNGETGAFDHITTVQFKGPHHIMLPELKHLVKRTLDPAQRRQKVLELLLETYYQQPETFSDILTATFVPKSTCAAALLKVGQCRLEFAAYGQSYGIACKVWTLTKTNTNTLRQATMWHNLFFNPALHPDTIVLGFEPNWSASTSQATV